MKYEEYLQKERECYKKRKESGKIKMVDEMSNRERQIRRRWKANQRKKRVNDLKIKEDLEKLQTPPTSPTSENLESDELPKKLVVKLSTSNAKLSKQVKDLKDKVKIEMRRTEKFKKRLQKAKNSRSDMLVFRKIDM